MPRTKKKVTKKATRTTKKAGRKPAGKATRKTAKKASKNMDMLLVASKTKEALKSNGVNVSSDAVEGLNHWVHWLVDQACKRAEANGRKTVRAHDFMSM